MRHISVMIFVGLVGGTLPNFLSTSLKKAEEISRLSGEIHIAFYLFFIPFPAKKNNKKAVPAHSFLGCRTAVVTESSVSSKSFDEQ